MHQHIYVDLKKIAGLETKYKEKTKKNTANFFLQIFLKASWNSYWQQQNPSHNIIMRKKNY